MAAVATKPFETNYRLHTPTGYVVLNGDQVTKIEAIKTSDAFGMAGQGWRIVFYLSDGSKQEVPQSTWTDNFVKEVFENP